MDAIESLTRQIGRDLFARAMDNAAWREPAAILRDKAMALVMRDEHFKASLFRLVDVLPVLKNSQQINRHLKEYLPRARFLPEKGLIGRAIAAIAIAGVSHLARSFIAATDLDDAATVATEMRRRELAFTIDLLGESVVSETEADEYAGKYRKLIDTLSAMIATAPPIPRIDAWPGGALPRVNVSIKLSSFFSQFDPLDGQTSWHAVVQRLRPILCAARDKGVFVCFDMEQSAFKDLTIWIFKQILLEEEFRDWPDVGIAIQAYLPAAGDDLVDLRAWAQQRNTPVWIRLVKGAYWDYENVISAQNNWPVPVYTEKSETDANFEHLTEYLVSNRRWLHPAVASHNIRDIAKALALAEAAGLPPRTLEFQMLFGMAEPIRRALLDLGQRVRIYAPVGKLLPGMAYLVRRLLENTSNQSFLRSALLEHASQEELLMNPATILKPSKVQIEFGGFRNEPVSDFSRADKRAAMQQAISNRAAVRRPLIIGGKRITTDRWMDSVNPSHKKQTNGQWAAATPEHAKQAIATAKFAFSSWRDRPQSERSSLLLRVADELRRRRFEIAALEVAECGKPWREADADIAEAIDFCVYYAQQAGKMAAGRHHDLPGETNFSFYEPRGVAAVIAPWNFPLAILCGMTAAAVVTGNTAIIKPAEQSSLVGAELFEAFDRAGAPPGVVNYLSGVGEEIGPVLVNSPDVALIAFTGSRKVGLAIQESAAKLAPGQTHLKQVVCEMGGKNAIIVDTDADRDEAIHGVTASAFGYAGQKCSACSRLILLDDIYDEFLARLIEAVASLRIAPAENPACFVGPVIDADAHSRILALIEKSQPTHKLAFAADVGDLRDEGFYIGPHIFTDVDPTSSLAQEEIFGPVLACIRAADMDHALEIANGTAYALTGGLYSRSPETIKRVSREFRVGDLYINRKITGALVGRQPFGGFKLSGQGRQAGGEDYLSQFVVQRVVTENTMRHGFAPEE